MKTGISPNNQLTRPTWTTEEWQELRDKVIKEKGLPWPPVVGGIDHGSGAETP